jgi:nicotinamide mononucleotide transporter
MLEQLQALSYLDWIITATALIYVFLAARNNPWCWVFGAVSCGLWGYVDIVQYQLYSDAALQAFYVFMAGVGIYRWQFGASGAEQEAKVLPISRMSVVQHATMIGGSLLAGILLGYFVSQNFPAAATYPDAITTTASVGATFLLLNRKLENWLYWVVIDIAYIGIYWSRDASLLALIMLVYVGTAIYGYQNWHKLSKQESAEAPMKSGGFSK